MTPPDKRPAPESIIVADIGGTNARFAIASFDGEGAQGVSLCEVRGFRNAGFAGFDELMSAYLSQAGADAPRVACVGIAGPVRANQGRITNLGWALDAAELRDRFGFEEVLLVNDFAALARMAMTMPEGATRSLTPHLASAPGPISVIGPGTGFGVALVVGHEGGCSTISTECGHVSFAPTTQFEADLRNHLAPALGHVSVESLLSGAGLERIHRFIAGSADCGHGLASAADVTHAAVHEEAPCCVAAVRHFLSILGSTAGDVALAHGAVGGVYLAGGILPRIAGLLHASDFMHRFVDKGPMRSYLSRISVRLITAPHIALQGAATLYREAGAAGVVPART